MKEQNPAYCITSLQLPLVQACFEGNVVQLTELIGQREDVNAIVSFSYQ